MNGQPCLFPTKDATAVYLKVWNQNGQLLTVRYSLDQNQPQQAQQPPVDQMKEVNERLEKLEAALSALGKREGGKRESGS